METKSLRDIFGQDASPEVKETTRKAAKLSMDDMAAQMTTATVKGHNPAAETKTLIWMQPHEFRELVNKLRDNGKKFSSYGCYRELIIGVLNSSGIYPDHKLR